MPLSHDEVIGLAALARIEVTAAEAEAVRGQLNRIFGLIEQLQAVDTRGVEPMSHMGSMEGNAVEGNAAAAVNPAAGNSAAQDAAGDASLRLREDRVTESDRREAYQAVAPQVAQGLYLVPKVLE